MLVRQAHRALLTILEQSGLALHQLDPWETWRAFKLFLKLDIEDAYDAASVQLLPTSPDPELADEATLFLIRQFSERSALDGSDRLLGRVVLEFQYAAAHFHGHEPAQVWTLDFATLEEWASVVEGHGWFQEAMGRRPLISEVYYDEGAEGDE